MRGNDRCHSVPVSPSRVDEKGIIRLIEGSVKVRDVEIATSAVTAFGDDEVDSTFDVGVVLVDRGSDVAVADSGREVVSKTPFAWQPFLTSSLVSSDY